MTPEQRKAALDAARAELKAYIPPAERCDIIRPVIQAALDKIAADHKLSSLTLGYITYSDDGFKSSIECVFPNGLSASQRKLVEDGRMHGLPARGFEFEDRGRRFRLDGLRKSKVEVIEIATGKTLHGDIGLVVSAYRKSMAADPDPNARRRQEAEAARQRLHDGKTDRHEQSLAAHLADIAHYQTINDASADLAAGLSIAAPIMTPKGTATGATLEAFLAAGWTLPQMREHGYIA